MSPAVVEAILLIASIVLCFVVIGFAFAVIDYFVELPRVMQVGTGTINSNGIATFMVSSSGNVKIVEAQLLGTNYFSKTITPDCIVSGINTITVNFGSVELQPGSVYTISLSLSDGVIVYVSVLVVN